CAGRHYHPFTWPIRLVGPSGLAGSAYRGLSLFLAVLACGGLLAALAGLSGFARLAGLTRLAGLARIAAIHGIGRIGSRSGIIARLAGRSLLGSAVVGGGFCGGRRRGRI